MPGSHSQPLCRLFRYTARYPIHSERKRIEKDHAGELAKLHTADGDFFHGTHAGVLATARMFKEQADVLHVKDHQDIKKITEQTKDAFPDMAVTSNPSKEE